MSSDQKIVVQKHGIGFCGLLFIVLLILKLGVGKTVVVGWSWWLVTLPLWGPLALSLVIIAFCLLMAFIVWIIYKSIDRIQIVRNVKEKVK